MFGKQKEAQDPLAALQGELAAAEKALTQLGEERAAARALDAASRQAAYAVRTAPGIGEARAALLAERVEAQTAAVDALDRLEARYAAGRENVEVLRQRLADAEREQEAARPDSALRRELAELTSSIEASEEERKSLLRKRAGGGFFGLVGELSTAERRDVNHQLQRLIFDLRQFMARRDELEGELDRRQRRWQLPTPIAIPSLPDERLPVDERITALEDVLTRIRTRLDTAHARRVAAEEALDGLADHNTTVGQAVAAARFHDLMAEKKAAWAATDQLEERAYYARIALAEAQGQPVARAV